MAKKSPQSEFLVERDSEKCISCQVCCRMCSNDVHTYDKDTDKVSSVSSSCVGCHFCEIVCPTKAITIKRNPSEYKLNANWTTKAINDVVKQAESRWYASYRNGL